MTDDPLSRHAREAAEEVERSYDIGGQFAPSQHTNLSAEIIERHMRPAWEAQGSKLDKAAEIMDDIQKRDTLAEAHLKEAESKATAWMNAAMKAEAALDAMTVDRDVKWAALNIQERMTGEARAALAELRALEDQQHDELMRHRAALDRVRVLIDEHAGFSVSSSKLKRAIND